MITIGQPYIFNSTGKAYLKAPITVSDDTVMEYMKLEKKMHKVHWRLSENYPPVEWKNPDFGLWFSVDEQYAEYLCDETADAFVAAMLWIAMTTGSDIKVEAPVSKSLLFSVNNYLIPALCSDKTGYKRISVEGPSTGESFEEAFGVGTGMSCGIDSMYTLWKYSDIEEVDRRLTHLTYFDNGAIFHPNDGKKTNYSIDEFYKKIDAMTMEKVANAEAVAEKAGLPLIVVASNMDKDFYRGAYGYTAVYRNCACVLAIQKLFRLYYCSSAGWPDYFDLSLSEGSEHYESLLCQCLSTESCTFVLSDYVTRIEKTKALADYDLAKEYLDVCFRFNNCGKCSKCFRTLLTLDLFGKVDEFNRVFDVEAYKKHKDEAYGWLLSAKNGDQKNDNAVFAREIYQLAKEKHVTIPKSAYGFMLKNSAIKTMVKGYHKIKYR